MKALLLSRYSRLGASSRLRFYQYLPYLKACGIEVTIDALLGDDYIERLNSGRGKDWGTIFGSYIRRLGHLMRTYRFDLVWVEKEIFPWLPGWGETTLAQSGVPYIVDYDDATFHQYDMHSWSMVRAVLGRKIDGIMRRAALVIAGNNYLAGRARGAGAKRVEYLPTVVDLTRCPIRSETEKSAFTIGWIGSPTTAPYLQAVCSALSELCKDESVRVVVVGSSKIRLDGVRTEIRPWSEETEVADIQGFDVGIMPMPDNPWTRGKCGYKLIQYMACARPVVASPVGVNPEIVEDGVSGFLAETSSEWVDALRTLRESHSLRKRMGKAGRRQVEAKYSLQVTAPRLTSLISSLGQKSK